LIGLTFFAATDANIKLNIFNTFILLLFEYHVQIKLTDPKTGLAFGSIPPLKEQCGSEITAMQFGKPGERMKTNPDSN
jgi:hypothetical protein